MAPQNDWQSDKYSDFKALVETLNQSPHYRSSMSVEDKFFKSGHDETNKTKRQEFLERMEARILAEISGKLQAIYESPNRKLRLEESSPELQDLENLLDSIVRVSAQVQGLDQTPVRERIARENILKHRAQIAMYKTVSRMEEDDQDNQVPMSICMGKARYKSDLVMTEAGVPRDWRTSFINLRDGLTREGITYRQSQLLVSVLNRLMMESSFEKFSDAYSNYKVILDGLYAQKEPSQDIQKIQEVFKPFSVKVEKRHAELHKEHLDQKIQDFSNSIAAHLDSRSTTLSNKWNTGRLEKVKKHLNWINQSHTHILNQQLGRSDDSHELSVVHNEMKEKLVGLLEHIDNNKGNTCKTTAQIQELLEKNYAENGYSHHHEIDKKIGVLVRQIHGHLDTCKPSQWDQTEAKKVDSVQAHLKEIRATHLGAGKEKKDQLHGLLDAIHKHKGTTYNTTAKIQEKLKLHYAETGHPHEEGRGSTKGTS